MAAEEAVDDSGKLKRRKVCSGKLWFPSSTFVQSRSRSSENFVKSGEDDILSDLLAGNESLNFGDLPVSCCSTNGSAEKRKFTDLEEKNVETETVVRYNLDRRESTPTSEFQAESGELESTITKPSSVSINSHLKIPAEKTMPSAAELEEFFAAAEKDLHKGFKDKYNYDIVKDVPMKGRFEWVQVPQSNEE